MGDWRRGCRGRGGGRRSLRIQKESTSFPLPSTHWPRQWRQTHRHRLTSEGRRGNSRVPEVVSTADGDRTHGKESWWVGKRVKSKCLGQTQIYKRKFSVINQNALHNTPHTSEVFLKMGVSVTWKLLFPVMSLSYKTVDNPEPAGVGLLQRWKRDGCSCYQAGLYKAFQTDPHPYPPWLFLCRKTLVKNRFNQRRERMQKERKRVQQGKKKAIKRSRGP